MIKRRYLLVLFITSCLTLVLGCSNVDLSNQRQTDCQTVNIEHNAGTTKVCFNPDTIAVLSPPLLDILLTLDLQPAAYAEVNLLAKPVFDHPSEQIPYLGKYVTTQPINLGDRSNPSIETLLRVKPGLIIGEDYQNTFPLISKIAPALFFKIPANGWQSVLLSLARVFGREVEAQSKLTRYNQLVEQVKKDIAPLIKGQSILVLGWERFFNQSFILESDSFVCELLRDLGFSVIAGRLDRTNISIEILPTIQTDHILVMPAGENTIENAKKQWKNNSLLQGIPAVQSGKVYFIDFQLYRIRGPIAAEVLIKQIQTFLRESR
jgi:iron complex transport system substrate-binding protein